MEKMHLPFQESLQNRHVNIFQHVLMAFCADQVQLSRQVMVLLFDYIQQ